MKKIFALLLAAAMVFTLAACGEESTESSSSSEASASETSTSEASASEASASETSNAETLKAGAGAAEIVFPEEMFASNLEGFSGEIHDNPHARILLMEEGDMVAIVSLELVGLSSEMTDTIQQAVSEATGMDASNVWVHCTHAITTPHAPSDETELSYYTDAVLDAVNEAVDQANDSFQAVTMGIGTGECDVNANRDIEINGQWYYGTGGDLESNKEMTIVRFDDLNGDPVAMYMSYGIKPTCIDNAGTDDNVRQISSDVPGYASTMMEEEYDCPVIFCMPAAGDQIPKETAMYYVDDGNGGAEEVELTVEEGIELMEKQGKEMGDAAIEIAKDVKCDIEDTAVTSEKTSFAYLNSDETSDVLVDVSAITVGDTLAFVGFKPEVNAVTEMQLQEDSPYEHTLLVSFLNGDQKYMPDEKGFERGTWEASRSGFASGCAEEFVSVADTMLKDIKDGTFVASEDSSTSGGSYLGGTVEMGGLTWTILAESDDNYLILCDTEVADLPYEEDGEATTWADSTIRSYLNGEFYEDTFSDAEKELIVETEIQNPSNLHYGIAGGDPTEDRVFLLSLDEAENYIAGTDIAVLKDADGNGVWWYLRSPGEATDVAAGVSASGAIDYHGTADGMGHADAIRPAMWVSTAAAD